MIARRSLAAFVVSLGCVAALTGCSKKDAPTDVPVRASAPARSELLAVGDAAPDFDAVAHDGSAVKLSALRGKSVILYFYPKDGTPGCTVEAQKLRDEKAALDAASAVVLGVSTDDNAAHRQFAQDQGLPFLLLPDTERSLAEAYGVGSTMGMSKRVTYLIGPDGKIARVYPSVNPEEHADELLRDLSELAKK